MAILTTTERKFCTELTRKHVSNAFFNAELESELGEKSLKQVTYFKSDSDKNEVMSKLETDRVVKRYAHVQSPSCENKGIHDVWNNYYSQMQAIKYNRLWSLLVL